MNKNIALIPIEELSLNDLIINDLPQSNSRNKNNSNIESRSGKLEIILGPMFAGKTKTLVDRFHEYSKLVTERLCVAIKYEKDNRYSTTQIITHDGITLDAIPVSQLNNFIIPPHIKVIVIDEGQFFEDINDFVIRQLENNRDVVISALTGDFNKKQWPEVSKLIPLADIITILNAKCNECNEPAPFSMLIKAQITNTNEQIIIGGKETYSPRCRSHWSSAEKLTSNDK